MTDLIVFNIKNRIHTIRGVQVILDSDLAELYGVPVKALNQAVQRNILRFPKDFTFQINKEEFNFLRSQSVTANSNWSKKRFLPYAFTEQGVATLSSILKSDNAVKINIQIMRTFVAMRKFISKNAEMFFRLDNVERKQIEYDGKFEKVFDALETYEKKQGIFFDGQVFDAYTFVSDLVRSAKEFIILIDNYVDDSVLTLLSKKKVDIGVKIYTKDVSEQLILDVKKFNSQYKGLEIKKFKDSHDRFLIIDSQVYHFGASLKDLGKKWFAFTKLDVKSLELLKRLR